MCRRVRSKGASVKPDEIRKLEAYLKKKFELPKLAVRARPNKDDSAEVYIGDEFIGVLYRDDDDDDLSWSFQMSILEFDIEES
eukprot:jgi/Tetstr1/428689/TSEL_018677.t1